MPFVQRNNAGDIVGQFANLQSGYAEEWLEADASELSVVSTDQMAVAERSWRDRELLGVRWLRERHHDQLEIGTTTTLTREQFNELLVYIQALRDWPQSPHFPVTEQRPAAPSWISQQAE